MNSFMDYLEILDIDPASLGTVMMDCQPAPFDAPIEDALYKSSNPDLFWVDGWTANNPHFTLKHGLMVPAWEIESTIRQILMGWSPEPFEVDELEIFGGVTEPYSAIVAEVKTTDNLMEAFRRLSYLPHVDTFTPWKPHVTLAYVHSDKAEVFKGACKPLFKNYTFIPTKLNLGQRTVS